MKLEKIVSCSEAEVEVFVVVCHRMYACTCRCQTGSRAHASEIEISWKNRVRLPIEDALFVVCSKALERTEGQVVQLVCFQLGTTSRNLESTFGIVWNSGR